MRYIVKSPEELQGNVCLPASKSISNRALILNALSGNIYPVNNLSDCDDTKVLVQAFSFPQPVTDIGAAGTAMRFLTAYYSTQPGEYLLTGTERMKNRPISILVQALREMGAEIEYLEKEGFPPLKIKGKMLEGGTISLEGSVSSQYISALMMIAPVTKRGLSINIRGELISRPYIEMTRSLMKIYGVDSFEKGNVIEIKQSKYLPVSDFIVENDWSAASYWYEMLALSKNHSQITLKGLYKNSTQGDASVSRLFQKIGVETVYIEEGIMLKKSPQEVDFFEHNFVQEPDLAQTFVVTCAQKNIPFRFLGLQSLKIKETDRILALQNEMAKLGYVLNIGDAEISWDGTRCAPDYSSGIDTYEDHRMAMAFAPVALTLGAVKINHPQVVSKSYPTYWENLKQVGFTIKEDYL